MEIGNLAGLERPEIKKALFNNRIFMRSEEDSTPKLHHTSISSINMEGRDGTLLYCRIFSGQPDKPHIIYYPAEYETLQTLTMLADGMGEYGFNLISLDYRGLGQSGGEPCLTELSSDADCFYLGVKKWMEHEGREGKLVIMGRSIGCVPALMAAEKHEDDILCMVLESAFDKTADFLAGRGISQDIISVVAPQGEDPFANREHIRKIKKPVIFIHSPRDQVQTLTQVEWLVAESRSKATQFQVAPSGTREDLAHSVGDLYCAQLRQYINLRMGIRPARKPRHKRIKSG